MADPYTIHYGPWAPDLANDAQEFSAQNTVSDVPCSDLLNVFYADGTYKSIQSPVTATINGNPIGLLNLLPNGALSFFDNVQQQQKVFTGFTDGIDQLNADGSWSNVNMYINAALVNINSVSFWSFATMGPYVIAVPYSALSNMTGPYLWSDQGVSNNVNTFTQPTGAPGGRVGAVVGQFFMVGDLLQNQTQVIGTGNGAAINFSALLSNTPMLAVGSVYDALGAINGTFNNGVIQGTGLTPPPVLPSGTTLNAVGDVFSSPSNTWLYSIFALNCASDPHFNAFGSITINGNTRNAGSAVYSYSNGVATWLWSTPSALGIVGGTIYPIIFSPPSFSDSFIAGSNTTAVNGYAPYQLAVLEDFFNPPGNYINSTFVLNASSDPGKNLFTAIIANGVSKNTSASVYSYSGGQATWTWTNGAFGFVNGSTYPITFAPGGLFFSTMVAGSFTTHPPITPTTQNGFVLGLIGGNSANATFKGFQQSSNTGQGAGQSTINYLTGAVNLSTLAAPASGDVITASYTQAAPYRVQWSAIGDPTNWPTPLTNAAIAAQSGFQDMQADLGAVMAIVGYPLYALIFQKGGISRAVYQGGNVVFSFGTYEFKRGLIAHGAFVQVGPIVYFLSDQGFFSTDGANVNSIGTMPDNSAGIDNWFWSNVNRGALESICTAYDASMRCIIFAIPTGTNTLPDTLLLYNLLAQRWTRASVSNAFIWSDTDGTRHRIGLFSTPTVGSLYFQSQLLAGPTMAGYLESCDIYFVDGQRRLTTWVRPLVNSTDLPLVTIGNRNSLQDAVQYATSSFQDRLSKMAPALSSGIYTRIRIQSAAASSIKGGTLLLETEGPI